MYQERVYRRPFKISDFESKCKIRDMLMSCSCGHATYLNRSCGFCGSDKRKSYFQIPNKYEFFNYSVGIIVFFMVVAIVVSAISWGMLWAVVLFLAMIGMIIFVLKSFLKLDDEELKAFWILHTFKKNKIQRYANINGQDVIRSVDSEIQEVFMDAYYGDLNRLEQAVFELDIKQNTNRDEWITILRDAQKLSFIYSNVRLARLQFKIILHLDPQDIEIVDLNHVCGFLSVSDIVPSQIWKAQHFLGDYLLLAEYTECDEVKRLFDAVTYSIIFLRISTYEKPSIPYARDTIMENLLTICGGEIFRKAWPNQQEFMQNGKVVVPNDADSMIRLADQLLDYSRINHDKLIATGNWLKLILNINGIDHISMKKLGAALERQYCFGWTAYLDESKKQMLEKERPQGYGSMYLAWRDNGLGNIPATVFTMLIPEEMAFVCRVWNHCVFNAFGICYQDISDLKINKLISLYGKNRYLNEQLSNCWKEANKALDEEMMEDCE